MAFPQPGGEDSPIRLKSRYDNYIGGEWVPPANGLYFENPSPVNGKTFCEVARITAADVDLALDAAHAAKDAWGRTSTTDRSNILLQIAQVIEDNLEELAVVECWENGKAVRETLAADLPLAVDHFRYFAGVLRAARGVDLADRRHHRRLPLQRAAGGRRPDHPLELPDPDGDLEAGAGAGRGQLRGAQAGRADAHVDPARSSR